MKKIKIVSGKYIAQQDIKKGEMAEIVWNFQEEDSLIIEKIKAIEGLKCARNEQMSFKLGFMEAREKVLSILNQKQQ